MYLLALNQLHRSELQVCIDIIDCEFSSCSVAFQVLFTFKFLTGQMECCVHLTSRRQGMAVIRT